MTSSLGLLCEVQPFPSRRPLPRAGPRITDPRGGANARCVKRVRRELPLLKKIATKRIGKLPSSTKPPLPYEPGQDIMPNDVIIHQFEDTEKFNNALRIFTRLPDVLKQEHRAPQIYSVDLSQLEIQLRYPDTGCWKVVDCLHWTFVDYSPRKLKVDNIAELEESVLKYVALLCDAHILISSDLSDLRFTYRRGFSGGLWPFLDTFDLSIDPRQSKNNDVDWAERRRILERKIKSQFQVFEVLAEPDIPIDLPLDLRGEPEDEIDPEDAVRMLKANPTPYQPQNEVLLLINRYTSEYGQYVIELASQYLMLIAKRTAEESDHEALNAFSRTITHVLQLLDVTAEYIQGEERALADRAVLWAAGLAIHLHLRGTVIGEIPPSSLLAIECPSRAHIGTRRRPDIDLIIVRKAQRQAWAAVYSAYFSNAWPRFSLHAVCFNSLKFAIRALDWRHRCVREHLMRSPPPPTIREIRPPEVEEEEVVANVWVHSDEE